MNAAGADLAILRGPTPKNFVRPLDIVPHRPLLGRDPPAVAFSPFVAQPPTIRWQRGFFDTQATQFGQGGALAGTESLTRALQVLATSPEEAGRHFRAAREAQESGLQLVGAAQPERITAVFGEALWGPVDSSTFAALQEVKRKALNYGDSELAAREKLMRATALMRVGSEDVAIKVLLRFARRNGIECDRSLKAMALIMYGNLLMNRATRHTGDARQEALRALSKLYLHRLPSLLHQLESVEALQALLPRLYVLTAEFMLHQGRSLDAVGIAREARRLFPEHADLAALFTPHTADDDEITAGHASPLERLLQTNLASSDDVSFGDRLYAAGAAFVAHSQFPNNRLFWKAACSGSLIGALAGATLGIMSGEPLPIAEAMLGSGVGAVSAVGAGKVAHGARADEVGQALLTGYTAHSPWGALGLEMAKLFGTYAFFGGVLPLADQLPWLMVAQAGDGVGQVHGLGSICGNVIASTAQRIHELGSFVSDFGLVDGLTGFWNHFTNSSIIAQGVHNAVTLPFDADPWGRIFSGLTMDHIPAALRTFSFDNPMAALKSLGLGGLYGYMGVSGLYAVSSLIPRLHAAARAHLPSGVDSALFPGAFFATGLAMMASGMSPEGALGFTFLNYLVQYRHHIQSGGDWRIFLPDVYHGLKKERFMLAGAVQLLYMGPGNAIKPHVDPLAAQYDLPELMRYIGDNVEAHFGIVPFLAMLGVAHASMTGLSIRQILKAKYAKAFTYEIPANAINLMLGWTSFPGAALKLFIREFFLGAAVTSSFRESGGSPVQHDAFRRVLAEFRANGHHADETALAALPPDVARLTQMQRAADALHDGAVRAALAGDGVEYMKANFHNRPLAEQLVTLTDAYHLPLHERLLFRLQTASPIYADVVYRALTDSTTSAETVAEFLARLRIIGRDVSPSLVGIRRKLIVASLRAAAGEAHGAQIGDFFRGDDGQALLAAYGLEAAWDNAQTLPVENARVWKRAVGSARRVPRSWIDQHAARPEDAYYDAVGVAGRRWHFSAPFTGRSLDEVFSPVFAFVDAARQGDPAKQTTADRSFYQRTLFRLLMTPPAADQARDHYAADMVVPTLEVIRRIVDRLDDQRYDIRHNLLLTIALASQGPHSATIQKFMQDNAHLFKMYGISYDLVVDGERRTLPTAYRDRTVDVSALFTRMLRGSDVSTDGTIVYPVDDWTGREVDREVLASMAHHPPSNPGQQRGPADVEIQWMQ